MEGNMTPKSPPRNYATDANTPSNCITQIRFIKSIFFTI